jgi:hypothetical protein
MARDVLHVVPQGDAWGVKREGNERLSSTHETQKDAIDSARDLASEGDDIVIHRPDGTIRERVTFVGAATATMDGPTRDGRERTVPRPKDIIGVGDRVSWQAILAGTAVAFVLYLLISLLAVAIGLSTMDTMQNRTFAVGAAIVGILTLLVALFSGGCVASRLTARETPAEAAIYGVLVWAALFAVLVFSGLSIGGNFGLMPYTTQPGDERVAQGPAPIDAQNRRDEVMARGERLISEMDPTSLAWWAFGAMALSLLAAVAGGLAGAGPKLVFRRRVVHPTRDGRLVVEERPAAV